MLTPSIDLTPLKGCRILVLEDEYFLADDIVRELRVHGARVIGPLGGLEEARSILDDDSAIDAAVLDINLRNDMVFPVARTLRARNVPFVFTTGYDKGSVEAEFQDVRIWEKPLDIRAMMHDLSNMIRRL